MVMVIDGDGDGDEVDGEYVKWLLKMLHWWRAAVIKDFIYTNKANMWQSYEVTVINKLRKSTIYYLVIGDPRRPIISSLP